VAESPYAGVVVRRRRRRRRRGADLGFHIYGSTRACENDRRRQRPDWVRFRGTII
jgi:hypothetical protein